MKCGKNLNIKQIVSNTKEIKRVCGNKQVIAVVKANAYAHGVKSIVCALENEVWGFAVANLAEALEIRQFNKKCKILVLEPLKRKELRVAIKNKVSITITNEKTIKEIQALKLTKRQAFIHLKIDCGMNRFGFKDLNMFKKAYELCNSDKSIVVEGVYTHFYRAEMRKVRFQLQRFLKFLKDIKTTEILVHAGGSLAVGLKNDRLSAIRVGIALYGYKCGIKGVKIKPALKVISEIIEIKTLKKGETVGYAGGFVCEHKCKIACCKFGYADGLTRAIENKNYTVKIGESNCPIIGRICMDCFFVLLPSVDFYVGQKVKLIENFKKFSSTGGMHLYESLTNFNKLR